MNEHKENFFIRFLKFIGIIKTYEVSKRDMCENAQKSGTCGKCCADCAWFEDYDDQIFDSLERDF